MKLIVFWCKYFNLCWWWLDVDKGFHTLCRSVLNIVNRSGKFIQNRGRNMGGRLHGADMSPKLVLYW